MPGALALRLTLALAVVLTLLALSLGLVLESVRAGTERELRESRFVHTLVKLRQRVEAPLALGLGIENLGQLQDLVDAEMAADPEILSIDLFDAEGRLLFSSDSIGIRDAVPEGWVAALPAPNGGTATLNEDTADEEATTVWRVPERGGQALGIALVNDFGLPVGGLAVRHGVADLGSEVLRDESLALTLLLLGLAGAGTLLGGLGFWALSRPLEREASAAALALDPARDDGGASTRDDVTAARWLGSGAAELLRGLQEAERRCAAAAAEVERIDGRG